MIPDMAQIDTDPAPSARVRAWWLLAFAAVFMAGTLAGIVMTARVGGWI